MPLAYRSEDRSLLLPLYRRFVIDPLVARLPARLSPNAITHLGHAINLAALLTLLLSRAERGMPFFAAALLVQIYVICDNADGAHARRTRQTSAYGEMLDHGLDILNVAYIAGSSALALGLSLGWSLWLVTLVTGASALAFFEQRATGVFFLGRFNQQEAGALLSAVLCVGGALGVSWWARTRLLGVPLQIVMLALVALTVLSGALATLERVRRRRGWSALWPAATMLLWNASALALSSASAVSARVALALVLSGNLFFAGRMLARRICRGAGPRRLAGPPPCLERTFAATLVGNAVLATLILGAPGDVVPAPLAPHVDTLLAIFCVSLFGVAMIRDARRGLQRLRRLTPR